jgi:hypothetical protein
VGQGSRFHLVFRRLWCRSSAGRTPILAFKSAGLPRWTARNEGLIAQPRCPGWSRHLPRQLLHHDLGYFDLERKTLQPLDNPFGARLSLMSSIHCVTHVWARMTRWANWQPATELDLALRLGDSSPPDLGGRSGSPSVAALSINRIDVMCQFLTCCRVGDDVDLGNMDAAGDCRCHFAAPQCSG